MSTVAVQLLLQHDAMLSAHDAPDGRQLEESLPLPASAAVDESGAAASERAASGGA
jgi:hypothetical protein